MLFVTLHGGKPERDPHKNNVHAYDKDGNRITSSVLDESEDVTLNELRGAYLVGKYLYVANANKTQNSVLCYEGSGTQYRFVSRFASAQTCKGILHPFDFTFVGLGFCYLSSQDTNVVTRLIVSDDGRIGRPAPVAAALPTFGKFLPGTFVASSNGNLSNPVTTPVARPAGLAYSPVHLIVHNGSLYVSGGDHVFASRIPSSPGKLELKALDTVQVKNSCGMTFGNTGNFYVASRTENTILKFDPNFKPMKFSCDLPDNPEFLLHV